MDALMQQEIAPIHPVKLSQVQAEREEATSYIDAAQQLKQEGYIEEADDCLTKAVVIYQTLVDQLLGAIDSAELFRLMSRQIASPVKQFQQFDEWRKEAGNCLNQGKELERQEKLDEAIEVYYKAVELNPHLPWTYHSLGDVLSRKGMLDEAISCYCECIRLSPDVPWSYHALGDLLVRKGHPEEAIGCYRYALHFKPDLCWSHNGLAGIFLARGELEKAAEHYRAALEVEPNLEPAKTNLEAVLQQLNSDSVA